MEAFVSGSVEKLLEKEKMEALANEKTKSPLNIKLNLVREFIVDIKELSLTDASCLQISNDKGNSIEYRFTFTSR